MKKFRMMTCLKCGHVWKSNVEARQPCCSKCKSVRCIDAKEVQQDQNSERLDKLEEELNRHKDLIHQLIDSNNGMIDEIERMRSANRVQKITPTKSNGDNAKTSFTDLMDEIDSL